MSAAGPPPDDARLPPGQHWTDKFPVMTAGAPRIAPAAEWDLTLSVEAADGATRDLARWDYAAIRALPQTEIRVDIHCVTRWSKRDTVWRGVTIDALLAEAGLSGLGAGVAAATDAGARHTVNARDNSGGDDPPLAYLLSHCEGGFTGNLRLADALEGQAMVALEYAGAPLPEPHGGPARLLAPHLYFWKSAKWLRRLVVSPYDRKGFWEKLGYHNRGDPAREQRYRGLDDRDFRRTLDPEVSRRIREERRKPRSDR